MDFINKVSAKAGEAFQTIKDSDVTKKAKNYAGIPGLQMQIGKCEGRIKKAYEEIGKAYFEANKDSEEEAYAEFFATVKDNKKKIGRLKAEIEEKKAGMTDVTDAEEGSITIEKVCPVCGRSIPEESAFCNICGHEFK